MTNSRNLIYGFLSFIFATILFANQVFSAEIEVNIAYLGIEEEPHIPLSLVDLPVEDNGIRGAELALKDNITTGSFLGHKYKLKVVHPESANLQDTFLNSLNENIQIFIVDLPIKELLDISQLPEAKDSLFFNIRAPDDELRNDLCQANTLHILPSRAMLADALAQYLAWKRWYECCLLYTSPSPRDRTRSRMPSSA